MSYLLDKKEKRKKNLYIALGVIVFIFLFNFRLNVLNGLSYIAGGLFRPILVFGNSIGEEITNLGSFFISKSSLYLENRNLQSQIKEEEARMANYNSIVEENDKLKEILGRKKEKANMVLAAILSKPNQSLYDTLLVDAGSKQGIKEGKMVFGLGDIPIGEISMVYENSSKVVLFSSNGERTQVVVAGKDIYLEVVGRGGGNFEIILPRDFSLQKGDQVLMPGINNYVLAIGETVISDPRDPYIKALLKSPLNIQELKFVEIEQ